MAINNEELLDKLVRTGMIMRHVDGGPCPHKHGEHGHGHGHERGMCHSDGVEHGRGGHGGHGGGEGCGHGGHGDEGCERGHGGHGGGEGYGHGHGGHGGREGHGCGKRGHKRRGQARVLTMVSMKEGINQKDLAFLLGIRPQTLGEMLQKLEERGLVVRAKSPADGRAIEVSLTDDGRARAAEIAERRAVAAADMFAALSEDEKEQLSAILDKLGFELDKHRPKRCRGKHGDGAGVQGAQPAE